MGKMENPNTIDPKQPEPADSDSGKGKILSKAELFYRRGEGGFVDPGKANNLWMRLQTAPEGADPFILSQLSGGELTEKITDEGDKKRFSELSQQLQLVASWELKGDAKDDPKWSAIVSSEANDIYYEMYTIARRNGISNKELFR